MCRLQVYMGKARLKADHKLHVYKQVLGSIHESPWLMIPIPAALVCPKTYDTVAEDACNIACHLSIGRTHDKWGIFRQSWSRHVREPPSLFKCEVRSPSFLLSKSLLDAICRAGPRAGCKCIWERLVWKQITSCTFTSKYRVKHSWITLAYDRATNFTQTTKKNKNVFWNCHLAMLGRVAAFCQSWKKSKPPVSL